MPDQEVGNQGGAAQPKRALWTVILGLLLGAGALWFSSQLRWAQPRETGVLADAVEQEEAGAAAAPALTPLALLALAGIAGVVATRGWPRRILCAVLGLVGIAAGALGVSGIVDESAVRPGHAVALLGGALILAAGVLGVRAARSMPAMGARYATAQSGKHDTDHDADLWDALSSGSDPTTDK